MKAIQRNNVHTHLNDEQRFNTLIESIENRDVVLIIGRGFEINKDSEENQPIFDQIGTDKDLYDVILEHLKQEYKSEAVDFSELNEDANFSFRDGNIYRRKNIHDAIFETIESYSLSYKDINLKLKQLINTGYFRFVFTTSFSPLVEMAMKEQWGEENVRVLNVLDKDITKRDICDTTNDLQIPTVYYLFGKADGKNSFVATDNDALNILQRWQSKMHASKILEATNAKHILALGCTQDDWLFRFIWYTLKGSANISKGSVGHYADSDSLEKYLRRNNILEKKDAEALIDRIVAALTEKDEHKKFVSPNGEYDVFISYSRKDSDVAEAVYSALTRQGINVWYDKQNLGGRGGKFMDIIYHAIENSRIFMPILTPTISEQRETRHVYRKEWTYAIEQVIGKTAICDCIPIIDSEYDLAQRAFVDGIPRIFTEMDGHLYTKIFTFKRNTLDLDEWASKVKNIIINKK